MAACASGRSAARAHAHCNELGRGSIVLSKVSEFREDDLVIEHRVDLPRLIDKEVWPQEKMLELSCWVLELALFSRLSLKLSSIVYVMFPMSLTKDHSSTTGFFLTQLQ